MSFGYPFGPLRPGIGLEIVQNLPDKQSDVVVGPSVHKRSGKQSHIRNLLKAAGVFGGATAVLTLLLAVPVFISEFAAIEHVGARGKILTAAQFADRLENLLIGSLIVAVSLVSFFASAAIASPRLGVRDHQREPYKFEPLDEGKPICTFSAKVGHV